MLLAAGRGERMRPLTDATPKPLLPVGGKPLIEWVIERLKLADVVDLVVNVSHLAAHVENTLGDGTALGVRISYSFEREALELRDGEIVAQLTELPCPLAAQGNELLFQNRIRQRYGRCNGATGGATRYQHPDYFRE